jgi:hypothetical protein
MAMTARHRPVDARVKWPNHHWTARRVIVKTSRIASLRAQRRSRAQIGAEVGVSRHCAADYGAMFQCGKVRIFSDPNSNEKYRRLGFVPATLSLRLGKNSSQPIHSTSRLLRLK